MLFGLEAIRAGKSGTVTDLVIPLIAAEGSIDL